GDDRALDVVHLEPQPVHARLEGVLLDAGDGRTRPVQRLSERGTQLGQCGLATFGEHVLQVIDHLSQSSAWVRPLASWRYVVRMDDTGMSSHRGSSKWSDSVSQSIAASRRSRNPTRDKRSIAARSSAGPWPRTACA